MVIAEEGGIADHTYHRGATQRSMHASLHATQPPPRGRGDCERRSRFGPKLPRRRHLARARGVSSRPRKETEAGVHRVDPSPWRHGFTWPGDGRMVLLSSWPRNPPGAGAALPRQCLSRFPRAAVPAGRSREHPTARIHPSDLHACNAGCARSRFVAWHHVPAQPLLLL